ncbi:hypothetical protein SPD48_18290 [Pseudogracilibacillus sp. SE30717A]|uniref:hypothetical protein n=1 Tax=Pseudogracilibacillus sp. SE30717A TaxID=3098293 RepID=UPI00300E3411
MLRLFLYPMLIILYILAMLFPNEELFQIVGVIANITIIVSFFYARGLYLYSGILFYIIGLTLFITNGLSWHEFFLQFDSMLGILALFLLLPFLNSLILVGRYDKHLRSLLEYKVSHGGDLYRRGGLVSHILGLFLNIATIPLVLHSLQTSLKNYPKPITDKFYTQSLLRAYALCLMWSPMEIMIIKSLEITDKEYIFIFPFLLFFSGTLLYLDTIFGKRKYAHLTIQAVETNVSLSSILAKIKELFILLLLLVITVTILNKVLQQGYLFSLVLLIIPISLIWSFKIKKAHRYFTHSLAHWKLKTKGLANFFFMFLTAGFFVHMVAETKILTYLQNVFIDFSNQTIILFGLIGLYFFITSFIGFHPLVSIVLLAEILQPILSEISSIPLAIVLIMCSLSTVMYSPFNVSLSILANELKRNSYQISVWNIPFALVLIVGAILFAYTIHIVTKIII